MPTRSTSARSWSSRSLSTGSRTARATPAASRSASRGSRATGRTSPRTKPIRWMPCGPSTRAGVPDTPGEGGGMEDQELIDRINTLANEEHELFSREAQSGVTPEERERMRLIEGTLDQCGDLLHQRGGPAHASMAPAAACGR